jgi:hypothetical protein
MTQSYDLVVIGTGTAAGAVAMRSGLRAGNLTNFVSAYASAGSDLSYLVRGARLPVHGQPCERRRPARRRPARFLREAKTNSA